MKRLAAGLGALALLGCEDQSMTHQPRYGWQAASPAFPHGAAALQPPAGVVAQEEEDTGPPTVTAALLQRGRERYDIFCAPCHGFGGDGDGVVVRRGFPKPPSYHEARLMSAPAQHFFDVITGGYGVMYSYATLIPPRDRWAIVVYIRALQQARAASIAEAPEAAAVLRSQSP